MITLGVDLAAEPARTAVAVIEWRPDRAVLRRLISPAGDDQICAEIPGADKAGIDCPLGWPEAFVELVGAHRNHSLAPPGDSGRGWRRGLTLRATDLDVRAWTGLTPLSVSADLIAHVALRWAAIEARLQAGGIDCRRDGQGRIVEVYPSASLKTWQLPFRGYKRRANRAALAALVDSLSAAVPWLDVGAHRAELERSDDCFDALVAALAARDAWLRPSTVPPDVPASREGWVHLPSGEIGDLLTAACSS